MAAIELRTPRGLTAATIGVIGAEVPAPGAQPWILENGDHQFFLDGEEIVALEPAEVFDPDREPDGSASIRRGRIRPGNFVGTVEVRAIAASGVVLAGWMEVRSRKLDFESRYRWMLSGIAEEGAELLLRSFSPTHLALRASTDGGSRGLYQEVAFLSAIIRRPHTTEALERIMRSPHVTYTEDPVERPVGRGVPGSSRTVRALTSPGPRLRAREGLSLATLPVTLADRRTEATIDNDPNRFVRFILDHWAAVLDDVASTLASDSSAGRRGMREVAELLATVEGWRTDPRFADVGSLCAAPGGDRVLQQQSGYREMLQAFIESRAAAMLVWDGSEDVHRAGQQDIAQLYEYWCYLELRRIVERYCTTADSEDLVEVTGDGLHLRLRRGRQRVVTGHLVHNGRMIDLELWFNRSFHEDETWTLRMRPDCSLLLRAQTLDGEISTWIHFDAKYRIDSVEGDTTGESDFDGEIREATRADILKMHAYRDAIRHSAGSYVLFPGSRTLRRTKFDEVLPGLGAVPFVPGSDGHATRSSADNVERLILDILDHVAHQASSRERAHWWEMEAHRADHRGPGVFVPLGRPPADVPVLVGYCRTEAHRSWVEDSGRYNLRTGTRRGAVAWTGAEASAPTLLLWTGASASLSAWTLTDHLEEADADRLASLGYPSEPRNRYLLRTLDRSIDLPEGLDRSVVDVLSLGMAPGAPFVSNWAEILDVMARVTRP